MREIESTYGSLLGSDVGSLTREVERRRNDRNHPLQPATKPASEMARGDIEHVAHVEKVSSSPWLRDYSECGLIDYTEILNTAPTDAYPPPL